MYNKKPKVAIITGASRGIGKATALALATKGWRLMLNYCNSKEKCETLCLEINKLGIDAKPYKADVSNPVEVKKMFSAAFDYFGNIDALVCNAGISQQKLFTDTTSDDWREIMSVNVDGAFHCCKEVVPKMISKKTGKIILVSSVWGITGASLEVAYSTAKSALIGMTKSLAKELAPSNIQVNCVAPGIVDTDMNGNLNKETIAFLEKEIPLGRIGKPEDIANSIVFLLSDEADYITGQTISPNGGFVI